MKALKVAPTAFALIMLASCKEDGRGTGDSSTGQTAIVRSDRFAGQTAAVASRRSAGQTATVLAHGVPALINAPVTERGMGPLRVGMTIAEARRLLGLFDVSTAREDFKCDYATAAGLPPGVSVMVARGIVARIEVDSASVATAEGARVGDTEARVRTLYGNRVAVTPHEYTDGHYLTVTPVSRSDSLRIIFETDKGIVTTYRAGKLPEVAYVEGCS